MTLKGRWRCARVATLSQSAGDVAQLQMALTAALCMTLLSTGLRRGSCRCRCESNMGSGDKGGSLDILGALEALAIVEVGLAQFAMKVFE